LMVGYVSDSTYFVPVILFFMVSNISTIIDTLIFFFSVMGKL
jgi:ABC-type proline/glycine betaine transport system permease subunit